MFFDALFSASSPAEYSIKMRYLSLALDNLHFLMELLHQVGQHRFKQLQLEQIHFTELPNELWEIPSFLETCCLRFNCGMQEDIRPLNNLYQWLLFSPEFDGLKQRTNACVEKTLIIKARGSKKLLLFLINVSIGFSYCKKFVPKMSFLFLFFDFRNIFSIEISQKSRSYRICFCPLLFTITTTYESFKK